MQDPRIEIKTLIHHIMHRHNIYKMDLEQIREVLKVLNEEPSEEPVDIQEKIFRGILNFNQQYQDHVSMALNQPKHDHISFEIKSLMHKLLHEFYFLNAIRAWEMFIPHFQQPGLQSQGQLTHSQNEMLNDQLEKARLHYMYYGPMSVYHFNQQPQMPPQPQFQSNYQSFFEGPKPDNLQDLNYPMPQRMKPAVNNKYPLPVSDFSSKKSFQAIHSTPRNRKSQRQQSESAYEPSVSMSDKNPNEMEGCLNKDLLNTECCFCHLGGKTFKCKCEKYYHPECIGSSKQCLLCRQAEYDPFNQVVWQLGSILVNFQEKNSHEGSFSLSSHSNIFQTMEYAVMVSCAHPDHPGLCWPDDTLFKLNDRPVFEIPALLQAHGQQRRKDRQLILTPYLASLKNDVSSLRNITFGLELLPPAKDGLLRRNNRKGTFQLCFFIVKKMTPDKLFSKVIDDYAKKPRIAPFDWNFYPEARPDTLEITVNDPYTSEMMDCPVRGLHCRHLQCFDLFTYLTMIYEANERQWLCPFCRGDCRELLMDKYQLFLFKQLKMLPSKLPKKITFFRDGRIDYQREESQQSEQDQNSPE